MVNSDPVVKKIGSELELDVDCGSIEDSGAGWDNFEDKNPLVDP